MMIEADDIMSLDRYELEYLEWNGVPRDSFERELVWVRTDRSPRWRDRLVESKNAWLACRGLGVKV
jgi:hypothetical protein